MSTVPLHFKSVGEGDPIVILHGLFGSLDNWQTMARELSEQGYKVITVDLRNHGKSPHTDAISHELMANDVIGLIKQEHLNEVVLVGHSMGGKAAMQLAFIAPELISKLVVVDIAPKPYNPHHNTYFDAMLNLNLAKVESRKQASEELGKSIKNPVIKQFLLKNLDRKKDGSYQWKFNLQSLHNNYQQLINGLQTTATFEKPTMFVSGQLSDYISAADIGDIEALFPNSTVEIVAASGHWVHAEQPDAFKQVLLQFLSEE